MTNRLAAFFVNIFSVHKFWITLEFFDKIYGSLSDLIPLNLPSEQIRIQTNNPNPWKFMRWSRNFDWFPQKVHYWHFLLILSALLFFLLKINVSKMWGEEGLNLTSKTTFCQHLESCSAGQGKVSADSRSASPIYEIGNALEYFVFWSNTSEIQSRRRCRVFVSLILLH